MKTFFEQAKYLDRCKAITNPSSDQVINVRLLIREEKFARYFFTELENPVWIKVLFTDRIFTIPPDPIEVSPGSFQLPGWPAGEYLARFADQYEEIAVSVVQSIQTENWRVQETLVDIMMKISPDKAAQLVPCVDRWLNGRFSDMLPHKLIELADYLLEHGLVDAAIQIFDFVITPILLPGVSGQQEHRSPVRFRADHFWVNEYYEKQFPKLVLANPITVAIFFEQQIEKVIGLTEQFHPKDAENYIGYYWRLSIPSRAYEDSSPDVLDVLIDGLRDSLAEVCKQSVDEGRQFLTEFLNSDHIILKRIAIHTLRAYGQNYPELVDQTLLHKKYLDESEYINEYQGLMKDQFGTASEEVRAQVISWILAGPNDIETRVQRDAKFENGDVTGDERRKKYDRWILLPRLEKIHGFLTGEALLRLNELKALYGEPYASEGPIPPTAWVGAPSPIPPEELAKKTFDDLKELFLTYVPDGTELNSREGLAKAFQTIVSDDPTRYNEFADYLADPAILPVYTYYYLSGIQESIKNEKLKLTEEILRLCEYVVAQFKVSHMASPSDDERDFLATHLEVARLLGLALQTKGTYLSREQLDRIRSLLITLTQHSNPKNDEDGIAGLDPYTQSLNCVRGVALHGIFQYSLYVIRQQEKLPGEKVKKGYLEPEIIRVLEERLDLSIEPSLAVRSVFGAFINKLYFFAQSWLEQHLTDILPDGEELRAYWKASWDAFILTNNVNNEVFKLLVPHYQRGLSLMVSPQDEQKYIGGSPNIRLAQHIMFAYLTGLTDFSHENMLLDLFFSNAPDDIRAQGIFWLSQVLRDTSKAPDKSIWEKCWALWQRRLEYAETVDVSKNTQEISNYLRWLAYCPVGLDVLYPTLTRSVKYFHDGFDLRQLTEYIAIYCEQFPLEAVTLLQMAINSAKEPWWMPKDEDEEHILRAAMASEYAEAKRIAIEIINYRGEHGDFRWKKLLD